MKELLAYHAVTDRPMKIGQHIVFDETRHNGVWRRVHEKMDIVNDIYKNPDRYDEQKLEHHTAVALRELALEAVRKKEYPFYPSRMGCLYVSASVEEAEKWAELFVQWGRPTFGIVRLKIVGNHFCGNANLCFEARLNQKENLRLAQRYWENQPTQGNEKPIVELLVDGDIEVIEIVKEINANLQRES